LQLHRSMTAISPCRLQQEHFHLSHCCCKEEDTRWQVQLHSQHVIPFWMTTLWRGTTRNWLVRDSFGQWRGQKLFHYCVVLEHKQIIFHPCTKFKLDECQTYHWYPLPLKLGWQQMYIIYSFVMASVLWYSVQHSILPSPHSSLSEEP
jgi:hypothetical protein